MKNTDRDGNPKGTVGSTEGLAKPSVTSWTLRGKISALVLIFLGFAELAQLGGATVRNSYVLASALYLVVAVMTVIGLIKAGWKQ